MNKIINRIKNAKSIVITGHVNPDGDAVGSGLALYISLTNTFPDKKIKFILQDDIPYTTKFLERSNEIEIFDENKDYDFDLIIFVDSATRDRTGVVEKYFANLESISIDHHVSNPLYADYNLVKSHYSSTSEIMYEFLKENSFFIDKIVAEALYLGIVNDTGNFSHQNVSVHTMEVATELRRLGVDNNYIVKNFLNSNSMPALKILGDALVNFKYLPDVKLSYYYLSYETMQELGVKKEDTEGLVEKILSYYEAEVSLFLREEKDGKIKGSMRSKHEINVNEIAAIFGGGGHYKAAGFTATTNADEILNIVVSELKK